MTRDVRSLLLVLAACAACAASVEEPAPPTKIYAASAGGLSVDLLTDGPTLETGLNPLWLRIATAAGQAVTDADVTFEPLMSMSSGATHGAPVIGTPALGGDGLYRVEVVFQMASSMMGSWSATVGVTRPGAAPVDVPFAAIAVAEGGGARTFSRWDPDALATARYVSSLSFGAPPRVGLNPVVVTLHRMVDMMTFAPVTDATMTLTPWMPSMSHGAAGSADPVHVSLGRYAGEVAFSMPGTWETTVGIAQGAATLGAPVFTTTF